MFKRAEGAKKILQFYSDLQGEIAPKARKILAFLVILQGEIKENRAEGARKI